MLLGHAVNRLVQVLAWNIVAFLGIVKCHGISLHCKVSNISGPSYCHVYIYCYQSFSHQYSVHAHPGVWWPLRELHFTHSAISYTLPCGCKQSAKVFAKDLEQCFYVQLYLSIRRLGHLHAHIYSIFLSYLGWYI